MGMATGAFHKVYSQNILGKDNIKVAPVRMCEMTMLEQCENVSAIMNRQRSTELDLLPPGGQK